MRRMLLSCCVLSFALAACGPGMSTEADSALTDASTSDSPSDTSPSGASRVVGRWQMETSNPSMQGEFEFREDGSLVISFSGSGMCQGMGTINARWTATDTDLTMILEDARCSGSLLCMIDPSIPPQDLFMCPEDGRFQPGSMGISSQVAQYELSEDGNVLTLTSSVNVGGVPMMSTQRFVRVTR